MSGYLAVTHGSYLLTPGAIKKAALLFNNIIVFELELIKSESDFNPNDPYFMALASEVDWLCEQGILLPVLRTNPKYVAAVKDLFKQVDMPLSLFKLEMCREPMLHEDLPSVLVKLEAELKAQGALPRIRAKGKRRHDEITTGVCRVIAQEIALKDGVDTVVLAQHGPKQPLPMKRGQDSIAHLVLKTIPEPDELTPWEVIMEFRADEDARGKFYRLKNWINSLTHSDRRPQEIEDELNQLLFDYEEHMRVHRMKVNRGILETVIVSGTELIEDLVKLRWSKVAKALFSVTSRRVQLLEAELKAPGRQIAYLIHARQRFKNQ